MHQESAPKASVIISVYNNLPFLQLVMAGFELQTERNFEIIISDDGSNPEFVKGVEELINKSSLNILHNWHEDDGFLKNKILNSSIVKSAAPYLIFVDGDCIPHPQFVREHLNHAEPNTCLAGRRVELSERITKALSVERILSGYLQSKKAILSMARDYVLGKLGFFKNGLYIQNHFFRRFLNRKYKTILGANFSLFKSDILAINGFDERYYQPTFGEDSDIDFRLTLNGVKLKPVLSIAVLYHCYHKLLPRLEGSKNLYEQALKENRAFTPYGIIKEPISSQK